MLFVDICSILHCYYIQGMHILQQNRWGYPFVYMFLLLVDE